MRLYADDDVRRVNAVWLGPRGWTFPFAARYIAWLLWFLLTAAVLLVEALTPLPVSPVPVWEASLAVLATYALMMLVDHDNPVGAVVRDFRTELTGPRGANPQTRYHPRTRRVRVRGTDDA